MPILMIFIDGLGLGSEEAQRNPLLTAKMPFMRKVLSGAPLCASSIGEGIESSNIVIMPTDALLNIPGLPQSATGQTTIFTGINAAAAVGRHINGFPTPSLRKLLYDASLFKIIHEGGGKVVFANTFTHEYFETAEQGKLGHSVTTTAALAGNCRLFMPADLLCGDSIYQDITNEKLRERGYEVPIWKPEEAAEILMKLAAKNDFTLFEYFQTDHCGHHQDFPLAMVLLERLDRFLGTIAAGISTHSLTFIVVSDHGNIEDLGVKTHTLNQVPTLAMGKDISLFKGIHSLLDIYPAVLDFLGIHGSQPARKILSEN
ncbi:MAG TPA: metalloenzyme [Firmicutes bacterium]|nr:metalloenzyme [Bacillota bacterium]